MESLESNNNQETAEDNAEIRLEDILSDPDNSFLKEHPANWEKVNPDEVDSYVEALQEAESLINKRLEATYKFTLLKKIEGTEAVELSVEGMKSAIDLVKQHQLHIGEGGDAYVVMDKNDIEEFPPEICYKFAKEESTPRGRNSMAYEAEIHEEFYAAAEELSSLNIGIPLPYYSTELGRDKILAMEKLQAKSIDDILRSMGTLPDWLDIE
ncbi:MAG: hypothetical protein LR008_02995, partial [Candidatus Pacebacteria bacterium]|nr:hypothetical protein [Candidatus Paceibacterota bacterium]